MTVLTRTRGEDAALISAALAKGIEAVIEAGQRIAIAQSELARPEFLAMLHEDLHITEGTASKLKSIASHGKVLPPNWSVLYALTQVPQQHLISAIKDGDIHPDMQRKDVRALLPVPEQRDDDLPPDYEGSTDLPEAETAEQDDNDSIPNTRPDENPIITAWANANREARHEFVRAYWAEIMQAREAKQEGNGAAPDVSAKAMMAQLAEGADRWIEGTTDDNRTRWTAP